MTNSVKQTDFNGDEPDHVHEVLWDKLNYLQSRGGIPPVTERVTAVVLGGGIAGLTAAYELRDLNPIVLEGASRFGGNSKGERWAGTDYSMGAAYVTLQDEGSFGERLLKELGLYQRGRIDDPTDSVTQNAGTGRLLAPFWQGATDPAQRGEFARVFDAFAKVRDHAFPDIPWTPGGQLSQAELKQLDGTSFSNWIGSTLGQIHPHVRELIHEYCWSSFAADPTELSAAQGLNFLASDLGGDMVFAGGNAAIAQALYSRLNRLRAGYLVIDVCRTDEGVRVCYETPKRELRSLLAQVCVVAAPKFVARRLLPSLEGTAQDAAMARLHYRTYVVANVLIKGRVPSAGYDVFRLTGDPAELADPRGQTNVRPFTDMIFANWANWAANDSGENTVLTLYKPFPYEGARQFAYSPQFYGRHRGLIESALPQTLAAIGVDPSRVHDIRLTRWGHALPVAATGLYSSGALELASAPVDGRIFFANQDNYANPSFESAITAAEAAAKSARAALRG